MNLLPLQNMVEQFSTREKNLVTQFLLKYGWLLIIVLPLIIFAPSLKNSFVYFDDDILILENQAKIDSLGNVFKTFRSDAFFNNKSPYYRPLQNVSFIVDAQLGGTNPMAYHVTNIILHILTSLCLFWFMLKLGLGNTKSLMGALIFSLHPAMSNAVYWIPARGDLMVALFSLLFFISALKFLKENNRAILVLSAFLFFFALFSKESAVILPFLLLLYLYLTGQRKPDKNKILLVFFLFLILGAWYLLRINSIDMRSDPQRGVPKLFANLPFLFETIAKFFVPLNYTATPVYSWFYTGFGILITLLLLFIAIRMAGNKNSLIIFGSIWFFLFCLPNMYVRLQSTDYSYDYLMHRAYLPITGLLIALAAIVPDKWVVFGSRWKIAGFCTVLVFLSLFSFLSGLKYKNGLAFWHAAIEANPARAEFHHFLSRYYYKQHDNIMFEKYLREAIALNENPMYLNNMGALYFTPGKNHDTAFRYFSMAYKIGYSDTDYKGNFFNLCMVSAQEAFTNKNYQKAIDRCLIAVQLDPSNAIAPYNLGLYYIYLGENKKAAAMWRRALTVNPEMLEAYRSLYMYYLNNTKLQDSINYFEGQIKMREANTNPLPANR